MPDVHSRHRPPAAIAPSILTADLSRLGDEVRLIEQHGAGYVHLDVMDGRFVPNISIGIPVVSAVAGVTDLPLDVHLMIVEPEKYIDAFADAGARIITVHVEASPHLHRTIQQIHDTGAQAGVALNPATPLSSIEEVLPLLDLVLIMSVNPGFGGQTFVPLALSKIQRLRSLIDDGGYGALIEVDGGIKETNIRRVVEAGADIVVVGSAIFSPDRSVEDAMRQLRSALE